MEKMHKLAFTLAEVLITLGIIGVVAALTIPTLMKNTQNQQFATAAEKFYSQFNQVLQEMANADGTSGSIVDSFAPGSDDWLTFIKSHYKIAKDCGYAQDDSCFAKFDENYDGSAHSTSTWDTSVKVWYKFITADGMSFAFVSYADNCKINWSFDAAVDAPPRNICGSILVDVNGPKKPNYFGRDVFYFLITSNKSPILYPLGGFYTSWDNTGDMKNGGDRYWNYKGYHYCSSAWSQLCTGRLVDNGWKIDW